MLSLRNVRSVATTLWSTASSLRPRHRGTLAHGEVGRTEDEIGDLHTVGAARQSSSRSDSPSTRRGRS